jgi:hypothetical protein
MIISNCVKSIVKRWLLLIAHYNVHKVIYEGAVLLPRYLLTSTTTDLVLIYWTIPKQATRLVIIIYILYLPVAVAEALDQAAWLRFHWHLDT